MSEIVIHKYDTVTGEWVVHTTLESHELTQALALAGYVAKYDEVQATVTQDGFRWWIEGEKTDDR
jgi:hypothetical protein